jgi:hypothetical protein
MENFRELEKELKRKQFSKKSLQHSGKSRRGGGADGDDDENSSDEDNDGSGSDLSDDGEGEYSQGESDYGAGDSQIEEEDEGEIMGDKESEVEETKTIIRVEEPEDKPEERRKNSDYLSEVLAFFKTLSSQVESDLEAAKNKKVKGPLYKKQKEKQGALQARLTMISKFR